MGFKESPKTVSIITANINMKIWNIYNLSHENCF